MKQFAQCYQTVVCLSVLSVLSLLVFCGPTVGWIKLKLALQIGLDPGHIALAGDPAPLPQRVTAPQFSAHICCGQMAESIKMPLGRDVGIGRSNIVLDGDPAPVPQKGTELPNFCPCLLWQNGWMDQDNT